jgi:hypothetical protein
MLMIDFPFDKLPRHEEICTYTIPQYENTDEDCCDPYHDHLSWLEDRGYTFCTIPCQNGLMIIQWYGAKTEIPYTVRELEKR